MVNRFTVGSLRDYTKSEGYTMIMDRFINKLEVVQFAEAGYFALKGSVKPRTREKDPITGASSYFPWVILTSVKADERSCILSAFCTCKGGIDGCCRHVQALLYEVMDFRDDSKETSTTTGKCMWVRRATGAEKPALLDEVKLSVNQQTSKTCEQEDGSASKPEWPLPSPNDLLARMKECCPKASQLLTWETHVEEKMVYPALSVETISIKRRKFMAHHSCTSACDCDEVFLESTQWSSQEIARCEFETRGQSDNENWHVMRHGLITASKVKRVLHCKDPEKTSEVLLKTGAAMQFEPEAIKFGKESEARALTLFFRAHWYRHRHCSYRQPGLYLSKDLPFLAATPDAVGSCSHKNCGQFVVEVKSLYSFRNFHPRVAIKNRGFSTTDEGSGTFFLKKTTDYYFQIQCQMALVGVSKGFLVIYTRKGIEVVFVPFDPPFWKDQCEKLKDFWKKYVALKL